ncbi:unnamed protein product [Protopolystoma xenopodis]|uniref:Uncharacterized protein n=1 Tax=Protopolystoma xenopodis TaxID=117903 RepID=A0A3S4ZFP9_9PLAT|nr:unnamed protein product [Protopolystoma xenopodis]
MNYADYEGFHFKRLKRYQKLPPLIAFTAAAITFVYTYRNGGHPKMVEMMKKASAMTVLPFCDEDWAPMSSRLPGGDFLQIIIWASLIMLQLLELHIGLESPD